MQSIQRTIAALFFASWPVTVYSEFSAYCCRRTQANNKRTSFLCLYFLVANSKQRASTCFCRYMTSISSWLLLLLWACKARAKALLLVFKETLKKDEVSGAETRQYLCLAFTWTLLSANFWDPKKANRLTEKLIFYLGCCSWSLLGSLRGHHSLQRKHYQMNRKTRSKTWKRYTR